MHNRDHRAPERLAGNGCGGCGHGRCRHPGRGADADGKPDRGRRPGTELRHRHPRLRPGNAVEEPFFGYRYPRFSFSVGSSQPQNDLQVNVVNANGEVVRSFYRNDVAPNLPVAVRWDGTTAEGRPARNGRYSFQVVAQGSAVAARRATASSAVSTAFALYGYAFPVLGEHELGLSAGRFGAARSGHTHQGQDVMAACGTPLVAARGGTVQHNEYEGSAGYYIVIDGKGTPNDFMYAHLVEPSPLQVGETVRTRQPIGLVGDTGNSQGCHLHFEIWAAPGWYEGGSPFDPYSYLRRWDAYS